MVEIEEHNRSYVTVIFHQTIISHLCYVSKVGVITIDNNIQENCLMIVRLCAIQTYKCTSSASGVYQCRQVKKGQLKKT